MNSIDQQSSDKKSPLNNFKLSKSFLSLNKQSTSKYKRHDFCKDENQQIFQAKKDFKIRQKPNLNKNNRFSSLPPANQNQQSGRNIQCEQKIQEKFNVISDENQEQNKQQTLENVSRKIKINQNVEQQNKQSLQDLQINNKEDCEIQQKNNKEQQSDIQERIQKLISKDLSKNNLIILKKKNENQELNQQKENLTFKFVHNKEKNILQQTQTSKEKINNKNRSISNNSNNVQKSLNLQHISKNEQNICQNTQVQTQKASNQHQNTLLQDDNQIQKNLIPKLPSLSISKLKKNRIIIKKPQLQKQKQNKSNQNNKKKDNNINEKIISSDLNSNTMAFSENFNNFNTNPSQLLEPLQSTHNSNFNTQVQQQQTQGLYQISEKQLNQFISTNSNYNKSQLNNNTKQSQLTKNSNYKQINRSTVIQSYKPYKQQNSNNFNLNFNRTRFNNNTNNQDKENISTNNQNNNANNIDFSGIFGTKSTQHKKSQNKKQQQQKSQKTLNFQKLEPYKNKENSNNNSNNINNYDKINNEKKQQQSHINDKNNSKENNNVNIDKIINSQDDFFKESNSEGIHQNQIYSHIYNKKSFKEDSLNSIFKQDNSNDYYIPKKLRNSNNQNSKEGEEAMSQSSNNNLFKRIKQRFNDKMEEEPQTSNNKNNQKSRKNNFLNINNKIQNQSEIKIQNSDYPKISENKIKNKKRKKKDSGTDEEYTIEGIQSEDDEVEEEKKDLFDENFIINNNNNNKILGKKQAQQRKRSVSSSKSNTSFITTTSSDDNEEEDDDDMIDPTAPKILKSYKIYVDICSPDGEDSSSPFVKILKNFGAKIRQKLTKTCTLMVWKDGDLNTYNQAKQLNIPIVQTLWVDEMYESNTIKDYKNHFVKELTQLQLKELHDIAEFQDINYEHDYDILNLSQELRDNNNEIQQNINHTENNNQGQEDSKKKKVQTSIASFFTSQRNSQTQIQQQSQQNKDKQEEKDKNNQNNDEYTNKITNENFQLPQSQYTNKIGNQSYVEYLQQDNFKIAKASQPRDLLKGGILVVEEKISANLPCSLFQVLGRPIVNKNWIDSCYDEGKFSAYEEIKLNKNSISKNLLIGKKYYVYVEGESGNKITVKKGKLATKNELDIKKNQEILIENLGGKTVKNTENFKSADIILFQKQQTVPNEIPQHIKCIKIQWIYDMVYANALVNDSLYSLRS
ncbi:BRCT domain [Pseudocohnilembus persalinus]|uniref:BRCT domain n=1 Tax=Pseudocohnilembus persalinus TaxID=266149 RepID=A0A0V0R0F1_PSEPJ|nr:BRCT domain [Pseudocohnilembus persalinus]|eukprot:KRX07786.1 BRCT domain [Pseudocohnilembus persalinus]